MAKKKTTKKKESIAVTNNAVAISTLESNMKQAIELISENTRVIGILETKIIEINARIDRIVDAVSKSKKVKGL